MIIVTFDFETRAFVSLKGPKTVGMYKYAMHYKTRPMCLGLDVNGEPYIWLDDLYDEMGVHEIKGGERVSKKEAIEIVHSADQLHAHNIGFEFLIWLHKFNPGDVLPVEKLRCSAAVAAYHALPRKLEDVCGVLGLSEQKDTIGSKAMGRVCIGKGGCGRPHSNHPDDLRTTAEYCIQDVKAEVALMEALRPLPKKELNVWRLDFAINNRGVLVDHEKCKVLESRLLGIEARLCKELESLTGGFITTGKQHARFRTWLEENGVKTPSVDAEHTAAMLDSDTIQGDVRRVLELRQELAMSSPAKLRKMMHVACPDGRNYGLLMYHGASTGRWTGRLTQPQNLPRGSVKAKAVPAAIKAFFENEEEDIRLCFGNPHAAGSSCVRAMFVPQKGYRFLCSDFASIEARALAWLAGQDNVVGAFRKGEDLYKLQACEIYGVKLEDVTKAQRQIGKVAILALGYCGGYRAFKKMAKNYGVQVPEEEAKEIVKGYRAANENIEDYWYAVERAAIRAVQQRKPIRCGKVIFGVRDPFLLCRLPSGRMLHYFEPAVTHVKRYNRTYPKLSFMGVDSTSGRWWREDTYGGKLVENITQALCRDIMVEAMFKLEKAGYPLILTIHDEVLAEVPEGHGSLDEMNAIMSVVPVWATGLPIAAEGWEGYYYRKD